MGRPKLEQPKNKNLAIRLTEEEMTKFSDYARSKEMTKAEIVREFVLKVISRKEVE
jgi:predicted DNA-binding protein